MTESSSHDPSESHCADDLIAVHRAAELMTSETHPIKGMFNKRQVATAQRKGIKELPAVTRAFHFLKVLINHRRVAKSRG
jgi:hypothetical protein